MRVFILISLFLTTIGFAEKEVQPLSGTLDSFINVRDFTAFKNEAYFTAQDAHERRTIMVKAQSVNGRWRDFEKVPFSGLYRDIEPFLSPDGLRLYFASNRPVTGIRPSSHYDIWYVHRSNPESPWSEPIHLPGPVNTESNEFYPAVTANNNLYFTSDRHNDKRKDDIYMSPWVNGQYQPARALSDNINSPGYEFNAYVAADESFLIYTIYAAEDGLGSGDLYISYRQSDGDFGPRVNLGPSINSDKMDYCPFYDGSQQRLIWTSKRSAIGDTKLPDVTTFIKTTQQYENGFSRLYQSPFVVDSAATQSNAQLP
ncbi:MAG: hypothetical protein DWP95_09140 [Proteobacteria bacterium]|nr:MAG: hypothetical protein DWP95_09140 [Pseudomonadota bacterium]